MAVLSPADPISYRAVARQSTAQHATRKSKNTSNDTAPHSPEKGLAPVEEPSLKLQEPRPQGFQDIPRAIAAQKRRAISERDAQFDRLATKLAAALQKAGWSVTSHGTDPAKNDIIYTPPSKVAGSKFSIGYEVYNRLTIKKGHVEACVGFGRSTLSWKSRCSGRDVTHATEILCGRGISKSSPLWAELPTAASASGGLKQVRRIPGGKQPGDDAIIQRVLGIVDPPPGDHVHKTGKNGPGEYNTSDRTTHIQVFGRTFENRSIEVGIMRNSFVFEGDILMGGGAFGWLNALGVVTTGDLWPKSTIPYVISDDLPQKNVKRIRDAIAHWKKNTSIRFELRTARNAARYPNYVHFEPSSGCASYIGMRGGRQPIFLASDCGLGSTIHEIGHAVGLWHEQSREDRNQHVEIKWDNIAEENQHNFEQHIVDGDDVGPYDYKSIMHYSRYAFALNPFLPTIVPKNPDISRLGQRSGLSAGDIKTVKALYPQNVRDNPDSKQRGTAPRPRNEPIRSQPAFPGRQGAGSASRRFAPWTRQARRLVAEPDSDGGIPVTAAENARLLKAFRADFVKLGVLGKRIATVLAKNAWKDAEKAELNRLFPVPGDEVTRMRALDALLRTSRTVGHAAATITPGDQRLECVSSIAEYVYEKAFAELTTILVSAKKRMSPAGYAKFIEPLALITRIDVARAVDHAVHGSRRREENNKAQEQLEKKLDKVLEAAKK